MYHNVYLYVLYCERNGCNCLVTNEPPLYQFLILYNKRVDSKTVSLERNPSYCSPDPL